MKKLTGLLLILSIITSTAFAQQRSCQKHDRLHGKYNGQKGRLTASLNLTETQKEQIRSIRQETKKRMAELGENRQMTLQQFDDSRARILKEQKSKMDNLLTADQKASRERTKSDMELQRKQQHEKRLNEMKVRLSLTDAQVNQLKGLREKNHEAIKAIKANDNMGPDAKRSAMKKIKDQAKEERKSIFTAEQLKKLEENKGEFHKRRGDVR